MATSQIKIFALGVPSQRTRKYLTHMKLSHSYELEIAQTQRNWKDISKIFDMVSGNTPN